ncbi:ferroxidase fet3 [Coemansia sp. RSA 2336]|nr:ferroxidase fet3 [Coemansia sp. RSA 2336]
MPIPPVHVTQGDILAITVHNSLDVPTSLHAHGLLYNGTSFMDGAGMVTQCGIPPGDSFTYIIHTQDQAGTFWIRGSYNGQNADGLRTALIIHEKQKPASYDDEELLTLEDWYPLEFPNKMAIDDGPGSAYKMKPSYPFGLINGYDGNLTKTIHFHPGKRYRFRVVSFATTMWFKFSLPGHTMHVVEVDGVDSEPFRVDGLDISPGQRFSVLVDAHNSTSYNYVYNCTMYANFVPRVNGLSPRTYLGKIEYDKSAPTRLISRSDEQLKWADVVELTPQNKQPLLPADLQVKLASLRFNGTDNIPHSLLGDLPYASPLVPTLFSAFTMGKLASNSSIYGPQAEAHVLKHMEVVEIVIDNPIPMEHSLYLHGHKVQVVELGPSGNATEYNRPVATVRKAGKWPMRQDTVFIPALQYAKLRFRADNPGVWLFRCQAEVHLHMGMAVTFVEAPDVLQRQQTLPQELSQMCLKQNIKASGNAAGNQGFDLSGLPVVKQLI